MRVLPKLQDYLLRIQPALQQERIQVSTPGMTDDFLPDTIPLGRNQVHTKGDKATFTFGVDGQLQGRSAVLADRPGVEIIIHGSHNETNNRFFAVNLQCICNKLHQEGTKRSTAGAPAGVPTMPQEKPVRTEKQTDKGL